MPKVNLKPGERISFRKQKGTVLSFYKWTYGYALNMQCNGFTSSFTKLTAGDLLSVKKL